MTGNEHKNGCLIFLFKLVKCYLFLVETVDVFTYIYLMCGLLVHLVMFMDFYFQYK